MSHSVKYDEDAHLTVVSYYGRVDLSAIREGASEAARIAKEHDCFLVLIDCREAALALSTLDIHGLPKMLSDVLAALGIQIHRFKRAIVVSQDIEDFSFFETVTQNRSQNAVMFRDVDEARKWLSGT
jgi:hypothetical protein